MSAIYCIGSWENSLDLSLLGETVCCVTSSLETGMLSVVRSVITPLHSPTLCSTSHSTLLTHTPGQRLNATQLLSDAVFAQIHQNMGSTSLACSLTWLYTDGLCHSIRLRFMTVVPLLKEVVIYK